MADARVLFRKGQRVRSTYKATRAGVFRDVELGTVVGYSRKPHLVRVQRQGRRSTDSYHIDYWEPVPEPANG